MNRRIIPFIVSLFAFLPLLAPAQTISLDISGGNSGFQLEEGAVSVNSSGIRFHPTGNTASGFAAYGISPGLSVVGILETGFDGSRITLFNSSGDSLAGFPVGQLSGDDPSLAVYPSNAGEVLVRDNINRFTFYNTFGTRVVEVSSGTQSKEGEAISEAAMDPAGITTVIYNPKIKLNGGMGSRAQILDAAGSLQTMYSSQDRYLKQVRVSTNGHFIALVTARDGANDEVIFADRYGNELNRFDSEDTITGIRISADAGYLTIYSNRRVVVLNALSGERVGSTSFRSTVFLANYFPEDEVVVGLTGEYFESTGVLNSAEFHAIHLAKRQLAQKEAGTGFSFNPAIRPRLVRTSAYRYRLLGSDKEVEIRASF